MPSESRPESRPDRPAAEPDRDARTGRSAAANRIAHQASWVEEQIKVSMERGDFDDLPGAGKPIEGLGGEHDPDWWIKKLVEREHVAILPPSLALRREDAELDDRLDGVSNEADVRREVTDFNERVVAARYRTPQGPPLVTMPRDVEETVAGWQERRDARREEQRARLTALREQEAAELARRRAQRRWWRRSPT